MDTSLLHYALISRK